MTTARPMLGPLSCLALLASTSLAGCGGAGTTEGATTCADEACPRDASDLGCDGCATLDASVGADASGWLDLGSPGDLADPAAPGVFPAWRQGMALHQWKQIPNSDLSTCVPNNVVGGSLGARVVAWNGMAADTANSILYFAGAGGHADYAGNDVCAIDLKLDAPTWKLVRDTTPAAQIAIDVDYYADGRPSSTHTYYSMQFVKSLHRVFRVGSGSNWGTGPHGDNHMNSFDVVKGDWDAQGTWPDIPGPHDYYDSVCKDQTSEEIYTSQGDVLNKFSPQTGTWTSLTDFSSLASYGPAQTYKVPCAVDHTRKRVIFFGDRYQPGRGIAYDIAKKTVVSFDYAGPAATQLAGFDSGYAWYDELADAFYYKNGTGAEVYRINAADYAASAVATSGGNGMPNAAQGIGAEGSVSTRWQRIPNLNGYVYYPTTGGMWFLVTK